MRASFKAEGNIVHVHTVRFSVNGIGNLNMSLHSYQDVKSQVHPNPIVMEMVTDKEPSKLFNFKSQGASLRIGTTVMGEYFRINRIIIFIKPVDVDYPR